MAEGGEGRKPEENPELERELKELEDEGNDIAQRIQQNVSQELNSHLAKLEEEFRTAFDDRIKMVTSQCKNQANEEMSKKQTDILRTNKVFREISRPLGDKWKPVFENLISDLSPEQRHVELEKVEREKPFMQSYKSLMTWKEIRGQSFDIREIVPVLRAVGLDELAEKTLTILDTGDKEALLRFDGSKPASAGETTASTTQPKASPLSCTSLATSAPMSGDSMAVNKTIANAEEILDDRHLLQVAKKLGSEWEPLAKALSLSNGEIVEIIDSEGKTYQGGFKMLWNWRESKTNLSESLETLIAKLKALNRFDVVQLLK